jgi:hypothetical protein
MNVLGTGMVAGMGADYLPRTCRELSEWITHFYAPKLSWFTVIVTPVIQFLRFGLIGM